MYFLNIHTFRTKRRLKLKKDDCWTPIETCLIDVGEREQQAKKKRWEIENETFSVLLFYTYESMCSVRPRTCGHVTHIFTMQGYEHCEFTKMNVEDASEEMEAFWHLLRFYILSTELMIHVTLPNKKNRIWRTIRSTFLFSKANVIQFQLGHK